jgi:hypothetical protein
LQFPCLGAWAWWQQLFSVHAGWQVSWTPWLNPAPHANQSLSPFTWLPNTSMGNQRHTSLGCDCPPNPLDKSLSHTFPLRRCYSRFPIEIMLEMGVLWKMAGVQQIVFICTLLFFQ